MKNTNKLVNILVPLASVLLAFLIGCIIMLALGANPLVALQNLWVGAFGSLRNLGTTLSRATPLIFTGLRISLGTAWMTLCAAEMLASNRGLGYMIQLNRTLARADLIVLNLDKPHLTPCHDLVANLVYCAKPSDVETVRVDGRIVMRQGALANGDFGAIRREVERRLGVLQRRGE